MSAQLREPSAQQPWQIRTLQHDDLAAVMKIERAAYRFPWSEAIFRDCLEAGYHGWALLRGAEGLVGYALMSMAVGEGHLLNLCIDPQHHGRGYGRVMMLHLMERARAEHLTIILLEVRKSNRAALRLYERLGFTRIGVRRAYYPAEDGREDAYVLAYDVD